MKSHCVRGTSATIRHQSMLQDCRDISMYAGKCCQTSTCRAPACWQIIERWVAEGRAAFARPKQVRANRNVYPVLSPTIPSNFHSCKIPWGNVLVRSDSLRPRRARSLRSDARPTGAPLNDAADGRATIFRAFNVLFWNRFYLSLKCNLSILALP